MRRSMLALFCWALPVTAAAEPGLLLVPALGRPDAVTLTGRVLLERPGGHTPLTRNLRHLLAAPWEGAPVEVAFAGQTARAISGSGGAFQVRFYAPTGRPFPVGRLTYSAWVLGASAIGEVEIASSQAPFLVISDFDDTLAVSQVVEKRRALQTALLQEGSTLPEVPGMSAFYRCIRAQARTVPLALVSGSPVQYVPRTLSFLARHRFPPFALFLRDLGPATLRDYKQPIIRSLLREQPLPALLIGDSGERDPEVYAQIRAEFPERIRAIYIRDAGRAEDARRFSEMVLFRTAGEVARHAARNGFADPSCVAEAFSASAEEKK